MGGKRLELTGKRFGMLLVISKAEEVSIWNVACDCGVIKTIKAGYLTHGQTKSCGCLKKMRGVRNMTHGKSRTRAYKSWLKMRQRVFDVNNNRYAEYGARGITICERWASFENFFSDMGERPDGRFSIERIDNNGNYCPENCRWATPKEQGRNTRSNCIITAFGETMCATDWAKKLGLQVGTFNMRRKLGWTMEEIKNTPADAYRKREHKWS